MEKIAQTSVSSNASSIIADLSKNLVKVSSNNPNFKDYIKTNNSIQKNEYKKEDDYSKNEVKNDDKKRTIHDEDKNMGKMSAKKEIKNTDQDNSKDETKTTNEVTKDETKPTSEVKEQKTEEVETNEQEKTDKAELEIVKNIINMFVNLESKPIELIEKINNLSEEAFEEVKAIIENMPQLSNEIKNNLMKLLDSAKKDGKIDLQLLSELNDENSLVQLKELSVVLTKMNYVENEVVIDSNIEKNIGNTDLTKELANLKQDFSSLSNRNSSNFANNNFSNITDIVEEDVNNLHITDILNNNIKIFGNNNARMLSELRGATVNSEQIQNFSKIVDEMRIAFRDDKTTLNIKLEPETLGKLSIKIHSENGILSASFFVESDKAKQAIENQIQVLKQALTSQNINIRDINVQVGQNNDDLNYHKNIMEAINFSKRDSVRIMEDEDFSNTINPYLKEDLFNDLI